MASIIHLNFNVCAQLHLLDDSDVIDRFPFGWKTFSRYLIAISIQFALTFSLLHYVACAASIALGFFLFTTSFIQCMEKDLKSISKVANRFKKSKKAKKLQSAIFEQFFMFISSHTEIQQLNAQQSNRETL